jgi:cellobiose transport system permease protein
LTWGYFSNRLLCIRKKHIGILFILPFFIFYLVFQFYPVLFSLFLSFTDWDGFAEPVFTGFANYGRIFTELYARITGANLLDIPGEFWLAFVNTWRIWLPNIIMQLVIAMAVAVSFTNTRIKLKGAGFFRGIFYFPNLVTAASIGVLAMVVLDWQHGALNQLLFGDDKQAYISWLADPVTAQFIISIIQTWMWFGYTMIILMAGLQGIPITYYEAAQLDGASVLRTFFRITLPLLLPILTFVVITSLIGGMQLFDIPYIIISRFKHGSVIDFGTDTAKALSTSIYYMYNQAFGLTQPSFGYAAAVSYMLFVLIAFFSVLYLRLIKRVSGRYT